MVVWSFCNYCALIVTQSFGLVKRERERERERERPAPTFSLEGGNPTFKANMPTSQAPTNYDRYISSQMLFHSSPTVTYTHPSKTQFNFASYYKSPNAIYLACVLCCSYLWKEMTSTKPNLLWIQSRPQTPGHCFLQQVACTWHLTPNIKELVLTSGMCIHLHDTSLWPLPTLTPQPVDRLGCEKTGKPLLLKVVCYLPVWRYLLMLHSYEKSVHLQQFHK